MIFKMAVAAILDVMQNPAFTFFSRVCSPVATFTSSSKLDNKWPSYTVFCKIQDGGGGHLGFVTEPRFHHFAVEYDFLVLRLKFHQNWTIKGRVIQDFVKFKMAAAAILDLAQNPAFIIFQ